MDIIRKFTFAYNTLDNFINEWKKAPNWEAGELTVFRNNCKKYLVEESANPEEFVLIINESTGDISINGRQDLQDIFYILPAGFKMSHKQGLYRQVKFAMEEAKSRGVYNLVFKEIREPKQ